jgi:hypothetical protein
MNPREGTGIFAPMNYKFSIFDMVFDAIKKHGNCFGPALFYRGVCNAGCDGIVCLDQ